VRVRAIGVENHDAEGVARPPVVTKEALQAGLLDTGLFVNGSDRASGRLPRGFPQARVISLWAAQDGIDECGSRGPEIEGREGAAVIGLHKRLSLQRGERSEE